MNKKAFSTFIFIAVSFFVYAQEPLIKPVKADHQKENNQKHGRLGIIASGDLSYMGFSSGLIVDYAHKYHGFYAGSQILLSDTYFPADGPIGGNAGYKFYFLNSMKRWKAYINLDYKNYFYKAFNRTGESGSKRNSIHEVNIGYGVQFQFWGPLCIGNTIAIGKYYENYYSYRTNKRYTFSGFDGLLRIFLKYKFS